MNSTNPRHSDHPEVAQLDRLRAGLLDNNPVAQSQLLKHVRDCVHCRHAMAAMDTVATSGPPDARLAQQLRVRRQAALAGKAATSHTATPMRYFLAPGLALATILAVVLSAGVFFGLESGPTSTPQELAQAPGDVPDVYADIDFYLWLSNHPTLEDSDADRS